MFIGIRPILLCNPSTQSTNVYESLYVIFTSAYKHLTNLALKSIRLVLLNQTKLKLKSFFSALKMMMA